MLVSIIQYWTDVFEKTVNFIQSYLFICDSSDPIFHNKWLVQNHIHVVYVILSVVDSKTTTFVGSLQNIFT